MLGDLYFTIIFCVGSVGLILNFLLFWLIIRFTIKEMQIYSRILLQTCIVDIIGLCVFAVVRPVNYFNLSTFAKKNFKKLGLRF